MKKTSTFNWLNAVLLHILSIGIILMLIIASPKTDGFTMRNPANWVIVLFLSICTAWKYILLLLKKKVRYIAWIFTILLLLLVLTAWIIFIIDLSRPSEPYGAWFKWDFWGGTTGELLFIYGFLCPILISSCASSWVIAPSRIGKVIFNVADALMIAMGVQLIIISKNILYVLVVALLFIIVLFLYFFPANKYKETKRRKILCRNHNLQTRES